MTCMSPMVSTHVDQLGSLLHQSDSGFRDGTGGSHKSDHRTMSFCTGIHIQNFYPGHCSSCSNDLIDLGPVASFRDVRDALYQATLIGFC